MGLRERGFPFCNGKRVVRMWKRTLYDCCWQMTYLDEEMGRAEELVREVHDKLVREGWDKLVVVGEMGNGVRKVFVYGREKMETSVLQMTMENKRGVLLLPEVYRLKGHRDVRNKLSVRTGGFDRSGSGDGYVLWDADGEVVGVGDEDDRDGKGVFVMNGKVMVVRRGPMVRFMRFEFTATIDV